MESGLSPELAISAVAITAGTLSALLLTALLAKAPPLIRAILALLTMAIGLIMLIPASIIASQLIQDRILAFLYVYGAIMTLAFGGSVLVSVWVRRPKKTKG